MEYILVLLTLALLVVLGLASFTGGAGPALLNPVQTAIKPGGDAVKGLVGIFGIIAVIFGVYGVIDTVVYIQAIGYGSRIPFFLIDLTLIVVGVLAGYTSVAAFFGAPASGAGKGVDWVKRTFGSFESIVGLTALVFAFYVLLKFILNKSGSDFL